MAVRLTTLDRVVFEYEEDFKGVCSISHGGQTIRFPGSSMKALVTKVILATVEKQAQKLLKKVLG